MAVGVSVSFRCGHDNCGGLVFQAPASGETWVIEERSTLITVTIPAGYPIHKCDRCGDMYTSVAEREEIDFLCRKRRVCVHVWVIGETDSPYWVYCSKCGAEQTSQVHLLVKT